MVRRNKHLIDRLIARLISDIVMYRYIKIYIHCITNTYIQTVINTQVLANLGNWSDITWSAIGAALLGNVSFLILNVLKYRRNLSRLNNH